ncbi:MAG: DUF3870 domain-containing protein [Dehalococcoidia bacterium]|nr:DUF3870 domain-containing protein [Dehalococcoidia bacterium]
METKVQPSIHGESATREPTRGTVIVVGHARLPRSLAGSYDSSMVSVELETDADTGIILGAAVEGVPSLGGRLLAEVMGGRNLNDGPPEAADEIGRRYVSPSHKALSTAVINAYEAYCRYQQAGLGGR